MPRIFGTSDQSFALTGRREIDFEHMAVGRLD
jgi:hypothetical protein